MGWSVCWATAQFTTLMIYCLVNTIHHAITTFCYTTMKYYLSVNQLEAVWLCGWTWTSVSYQDDLGKLLAASLSLVDQCSLCKITEMNLRKAQKAQTVVCHEFSRSLSLLLCSFYICQKKFVFQWGFNSNINITWSRSAFSFMAQSRSLCFIVLWSVLV